MKTRLNLINLGCVRNTVDSQNMIAAFERKGCVITSLEQADVAVVNTCGFIEAAKQESIDVILDLLELKKKGRLKKVIVAGCLAQRYAAELAGELDGVDAFMGVQSLSSKKPQASAYLTPPHYAYLKICESCFNACSFCAIPKIKGKFISRPMGTVIEDARRLAVRGVKEINIIGQDITAYGLDIYRRKALAELVVRLLADVPGVPWLRLLYLHPAHITDELLDVVALEKRVCKYLDIPLQHVSSRVLKAMNRGMTLASTVALVTKIRRKIPGAFLRTTFIVGFPGETEKDFAQLLKFVKEHPFERVGVFTYSREEGTPAHDLPGQVPAAVAKQRHDRLMEVQQGISARRHEALVGRKIEVLIEARVPNEMACYTGRSAFDAPDVDGTVDVTSTKPLHAGDLVRVRITGAEAYDLQGEAE